LYMNQRSRLKDRTSLRHVEGSKPGVLPSYRPSENVSWSLGRTMLPNDLEAIAVDAIQLL